MIQHFHFWVLCPKELKSKIQEGNCTPMFTAALTHNSQKVEATPVQWWINKAYTGYNIIQLPPQRKTFMTHAVQRRYLVHYAK